MLVYTTTSGTRKHIQYMMLTSTQYRTLIVYNVNMDYDNKVPLLRQQQCLHYPA
jgi:hypothetical protein